MKCFYSLLLLFLVLEVSSQTLISGPVVGGVNQNSARVYLRTDQPTEIEIELDTLQSFTTSFTVNDSTRSDNFAVVIAEVEGLVSNKQYFYRLLVNGALLPEVYRFRSFPEVGEAGH